nr:immunoglobulin heavy chain junction region [Mus musculus]
CARGDYYGSSSTGDFDYW